MANEAGLRIGIVGGGVVGRATARCWIEHCDEVRVYDKVPELGTHSLESVLGCNFVFVCLPTPRLDGVLRCDISYVDKFFQEAALIRDDAYYVLRSTVPIGTTRLLREKYKLPQLIHSPEFLTARCALTDAQIPSRNIIGGPAVTNFKKLSELYRRRFPGVPLIQCDSDESEAIKLFTNGFFAVKVAFWNEVRTLADHFGMRWDLVMAGILADGRIHPSHTQVPGPDGERGFGGTCLPKDLASLVSQLWEASLDSSVTTAAHLRNALVDRINKAK